VTENILCGVSKWFAAIYQPVSTRAIAIRVTRRHFSGRPQC
jgi:hypothetical protein